MAGVGDEAGEAGDACDVAEGQVTMHRTQRDLEGSALIIDVGD